MQCNVAKCHFPKIEAERRIHAIVLQAIEVKLIKIDI